MSLRIYNSLSRKKEPFVPMHPGHVGMYVCGVTVYDYSHVGHARVMVVFDLIYRWLQQMGFDVTYVRNFTDIDDKIIKRAVERAITTEALTSEMIEAFYHDMDALGCLRPSLEPKATAHIPQIVAMIERLIEKDFAYVASNGDVMYAVRKFDHYGQLSGKDIDELEAGSRVDVDTSKRDPLDFVLWKQAKPDEPSWDSPWGKGRPGWHIECSAMSCTHLGNTFDIHGGGMDLKFPHHENEIAQAEAANGEPFAKVWVHNGFVNINAEKMSKSLGNFFTIREVVGRYHPDVLRMFIIGTHYRSPLDFSDAALNNAKEGLDRLYKTKWRMKHAGILENYKNLFSCSNTLSEQFDVPDTFKAAMNDDFNTPEALAVLFKYSKEINIGLDSLDTLLESPAGMEMVGGFIAMCDCLGIVQEDPDAWFQGPKDEDEDKIKQLINERLEAKKERDFARADQIRNELAVMGIVLEDGPGGTTWTRNK